MKRTGPEPDPHDGDAANAGDPDPIEKRIDVTPGEPVSFEVPANTNLVINVINEKPQGFFASLLSGLSCFATGFVVLVIVFWIIGSLTP
jgi:hypothetical protein